MSQTLVVPRLSLVLLVGPTGAGKSQFAARHFAPTEVVSSDHLRAMIDDDENSQAATNDAFEVLRLLVDKRLARGRLTCVDATNVNIEDRRPLVKLAQRHHAAPVAIVLKPSKDVCLQRAARREDRGTMSPKVVDRQYAALEKGLPGIRREGFYRVYTLNEPEQIDAASIERERMRSDRTDDAGPFDVIGDVHGCFDELTDLLAQCGYGPDEQGVWRHPDGRRAMFLGNFIDRGPKPLETLRLVMAMSMAETAIALPGNHEDALLNWLRGKSSAIVPGFRDTITAMDQVPEAEYDQFKADVIEFLSGLESHYILDAGQLVVAHAGMPAELAGRMGVRRFALHGENKSEPDGFSKRKAPLWAQRYRAKAKVLYGHLAVHEPKRVHNTLNINTGCVFGGALTALRYPEGDIVNVPARQVYYQPQASDPKTESFEPKGQPPESQATGTDAPAKSLSVESRQP